MGAGERHHFLASLEDAPRASHDLLAGIRERDVVRLPLDQLHAEILLELLELRRQRRLAHEAPLGSPSEMAAIGHRHQITQVLELDVDHRGTDIWCLSRL